MPGVFLVTDYGEAQPDGETQVLARLIEGKILPPSTGYLTLNCQLVADSTVLLVLNIRFSSYPTGPYPSDLDGNYIFYTDKPIPEEYRRFVETGLELRFQ